MKKLMIYAMSILTVFALVGCGAKKEEAPKAEKTVAPKTEKAAPKAEKLVEAVEEKAPKAKASKKGDDLVIIEGIGPKAAEALVAAGVDTFAKLAAASAEEVKAILDASTSKVQHLDPTTWAQQAQLAADGKMDELKKLQDELNGGKAV